MAEFKGTKGKWKLANNDYGCITSVRNIDDTRKVCVSRVNDIVESNANMLLISKAPEMLEMLNKFVEKDLFDYEQGEPSESYFQYMNEAKKLIKEATEL